MSNLFDQNVLKQRLKRRLPHWPHHDFLHRHAATIVRDRFYDIKRDFAHMAEIAWQPIVADAALRQSKDIKVCDDMTPLDSVDGILPLTPHTYDALVSHMVLHLCDDPGLMLQQYYFALKPDGVFIGSVLGGESLQELRSVLADAEQEMYGGLSPRVHPMMALQDAAALLQQAGFALPVADSERITVTYADLKALLADLRGTGQSNALQRRRKQPLSRAFWQRVEDLYKERFSDERGRLIVTLDVLYLLGWAPDASQPQPKKRGSAMVPLSAVLSRQN